MFSDNIYDPFSLPQILGYIATIFGIIGFQQKDDTKLKIFVLMMSVFIVSHFVLMGSYTAAISAALAASRWGLSIFVAVRARAYIFVPLFVTLFITSGILTYEQWYDALPPIASICGTFALFYFTRIRLRLMLLFGGSLWLIHNVFALSYGPMMMEGFIFVSNAIMIGRFILENKKLPRDPKDSFLSRFG
jgi:uncharacterized membrane protein (UPF0136 family)